MSSPAHRPTSPTTGQVLAPPVMGFLLGACGALYAVALLLAVVLSTPVELRVS